MRENFNKKILKACPNAEIKEKGNKIIVIGTKRFLINQNNLFQKAI